MTNCELMELNNDEQNKLHKLDPEINNSNAKPLKQEVNYEKKESFSVFSHKRKPSIEEQEAENKIKKRPKRKATTKPIQRQPEVKIHYDNEDIFTDKKYFIEIETSNVKPQPSDTIEDIASGIQNLVTNTQQETSVTCGDTPQNQQIESQRTSKIKILSEEPFCHPLPELPALVTVPPSYVLHVPDRKKEIGKLVNNDNNELNQFDKSEPLQNTCSNIIQDVSNLEAVICNPPETNHENENGKRKFTQQDNTFTDYKPEKDNNMVTHISHRSRAISDERTAAIQEKRKFNKKLRDIITDSLNLLDEQANENVKAKSEMMCQPEFPGIQNQLISFLDNRLSRMEEKLLKRIDSNTQEIVNIKNVFGHFQKDQSPFIKTTETETDELHKKNLFQEISKYLSSDAKSLVYEELFINKHLPEWSRRTSKR